LQRRLPPVGIGELVRKTVRQLRNNLECLAPGLLGKKLCLPGLASSQLRSSSFQRKSITLVGLKTASDAVLAFAASISGCSRL